MSVLALNLAGQLYWTARVPRAHASSIFHSAMKHWKPLGPGPHASSNPARIDASLLLSNERITCVAPKTLRQPTKWLWGTRISTSDHGPPHFARQTINKHQLQFQSCVKLHSPAPISRRENRHRKRAATLKALSPILVTEPGPRTN